MTKRPELFVNFKYTYKIGQNYFDSEESTILEWNKPIRTEEDLYDLQKWIACWKKGINPDKDYKTRDTGIHVIIKNFRRVED